MSADFSSCSSFQQVIIIVLKASTTDFLLGTNHTARDFQSLLQRLQKCFQTRHSDRHIRELVVQTCQNHLALVYPDVETKDLFMGHIAVAAMSIAHQGLFQNAVSAVTNGFDEGTFSVLGKLISFDRPVVPEYE